VRQLTSDGYVRIRFICGHTTSELDSLSSTMIS
jgi:hypothetical protein